MSTLTIKSTKFESKTHEAQLEDLKAKEKLKMVISKKEKPQNQQVAWKAAKPKKGQRKAQNQTPLKQTFPNHLSARSPP
jgi:hypothetical protein